MVLLPEGTLRRKYFEACDRWLGNAIFGDPRTVSTHLGNILRSGNAKPRHYFSVALIDLLEYRHCWKNADKK